MANRTDLLGVLAAEGSRAYSLGYALGRLLVLGLVVAAVVAVVRSFRSKPPTGYGGGPPPGWHPDPAGGPFLRWWDGTQWTDQTSAGPPS